MKTFLFSFLVFFASIDIYAQMDCMHLCLDKNYCREACEMRKLCTTLFKEKRTNLTATEQSLVKQYAGLCPYDYGNAVYIARDLYALIDPSVVFMTLDVCKPELVAVAAKTDEMETVAKSEARLDAVELGNNSPAAKNDFVFSPNPSDGKFTLTYYLKAEHAGWVQISSAEGKGVGKYKISGEASTLIIDLSNQASGVYYATIVVEGMVVNKTKLVLEH